jgi:hypothetical protein
MAEIARRIRNDNADYESSASAILEEIQKNGWTREEYDSANFEYFRNALGSLILQIRA